MAEDSPLRVNHPMTQSSGRRRRDFGAACDTRNPVIELGGMRCLSHGRPGKNINFKVFVWCFRIAAGSPPFIVAQKEAQKGP